MGDHDHGVPSLIERLECFNNLLACLGIKTPSRFIAKQNSRFENKARAMATRCFWPPLKLFGCSCVLSCRPVRRVPRNHVQSDWSSDSQQVQTRLAGRRSQLLLDGRAD